MVVPGTDREQAQVARTRWPALPGRRVVLVIVAVVLAIGLLAVLLAVLRPGRPGASGAVVDRNAHTAVAPLDGRDRAVFDLVTGVAAARLRVADLGDQLYRISTPTDGALLPRPEIRDDRVLLHLGASGRGGPGTVEVLLSERVGWQVRITGGAADLDLDLARGRLTGVELAGGASRIDLRLPRPEGTLGVRMSGGVGRLAVRLPAVLPARIRVAAGAGSVGLYDDRRSGVGPGTELSRPDWAAATDRLDLDLVAGAETVTVDRG